MKRSTFILASIITLLWSTTTLADVTCAVDTPTQTGTSWDVLCSDDGNGDATKYWCNVAIAITTTNSADAVTMMVNGNVAQNQQNAGLWFGAMLEGDTITNVQLGEVDCDAQDD